MVHELDNRSMYDMVTNDTFLFLPHFLADVLEQLNVLNRPFQQREVSASPIALSCPACLPCVEGRQRAAPHSSFPSTTAPLRTLHMDVWGPARVIGQGRERYFLQVVHDYTWYTTVFPLRSMGEVSAVLIPWIRTVRLQLRKRFGQDLPVLRLHSGRGGEFSSDLLRDFFMEVARTSMIHAAAPHFLWPFAVVVVSGGAQGAASGGAASGGVETGGAGSEGAGSGGAELEGVEPWGAESEGAESGGAETQGAALSGGPAGASPRLSSQQLREWLVQRPHRRSGAPVASEPEDAGAGGASVPTGAGDPTEPGAAGVGGVEAAGAVDLGAGGAGGTVRPRPYFVPLLQQVLGVPSSTGLPPPFLCPPPDKSQPLLQPASPLPVPSPYTEQSGGSAADSALVAELLEFSAACRLDYASTLVAEFVSATPPSVEGECALGTDVLEDRQEEFECLAAAVPRFALLLLAPEGDPDAPDIPTLRSYAKAITGPYSSQWQAAMDAEMASWKSTGTYVDEVPPPGVNIVNGMWIFRVKRPLGSPPAFKARFVARGFSQRQGVDYFQTFSPTLKMANLQVLLHVAAQRDYELHSLDFSTAFLQGSLHEEIWLRRLPGFTRSFPTGTQWSLRRPVYGLRQAPRKWHDTFRTTLAALGFVPCTADPSPFLRTDTSLPPFYVLVHSLSAPPLDESVEPSGPYPELVGCLITSGMGLVLGGRGPIVLTGHADASWVDDSATQRSSQGYTFSLGSGSVSWWPTRSCSVLSSSCEAEIYAGAMAAQELCWLTYLLTDLGEQPHSPPVLYVDNKAMIALCQDHRRVHRTKHIAMRYFLSRELLHLGQLRLAYVATRANSADVFTKALPPGDHQRFVTVFGLMPTLPRLLTA
ncbi:unnamed protein product [Closterium sp. NIES-54]